jgi:hypothetical protein
VSRNLQNKQLYQQRESRKAREQSDGQQHRADRLYENAKARRSKPAEQ